MSGDIPGGKKITRRQFFLYSWVATSFALLGEGLGILFAFLRPREEAESSDGWLTIGKVEDFPVGSVTLFGREKLYLVRLEGGFLAQYRVCPHLGCIASWEKEYDRFWCPCHAGVFSRTGEVMAGPPPRPLDLFPVEVVEGEIRVDTSTIMWRKSFEESQLARA